MSLPTTQHLNDECGRRESLFARLAEDPPLPSPPGIVMQILEKASRPDCTPGDLAALIHRDAALCAKILKSVNSAFYGLPRSITSVRQAVTLLGLNRLRSLVLSLSLPALQQQTSRTPLSQTFWKESVAGAIIAHELAIRLRRPNPDDDLVAGLLRDIGVLVLQKVCPAEYARLQAEAGQQLSGDWCRLEREFLGADHTEAGALLLRRWLLPEEIVEAVRHHHAPKGVDGLPQTIADRARLLAFASLIVQLQFDSPQPSLLRDILAFGREYYGMDESDLAAFLEPLAKKIEEYAALLDLDIGDFGQYSKVLTRAAETLAQLTLETSVDQVRILEQKHQAEQETQLWRAEVERLRDEAARDPLTGAFNRGCLEEQLRLQFRRARRRGTLMGLIFIDLDDFKAVNDRFGHRFGDRVLRETSQHLSANVRNSDVVARYGGDEFCILVENTSPERIQAMSERLWRVFNDSAVQRDGHRASLGVVVCFPRTCPLPATELLDVADQAMYAAKSRGKNQITFVSLLSDADSAFLQAVQGIRFRTWLMESGIEISFPHQEEGRESGVRLQAPGRLARRLGWLTAAQLRDILCEQRATGRRFDEIVRERGLLTQDRLTALLALQLEPPECCAADLVKRRILSEVEAHEKLRSYYCWLAGRNRSIRFASSPEAARTR
jgi:diguanylate cyclase (GGDEF)-like protein